MKFVQSNSFGIFLTVCLILDFFNVMSVIPEAAVTYKIVNRDYECSEDIKMMFVVIKEFNFFVQPTYSQLIFVAALSSIAALQSFEVDEGTELCDSMIDADGL